MRALGKFISFGMAVFTTTSAYAGNATSAAFAIRASAPPLCRMPNPDFLSLSDSLVAGEAQKATLTFPRAICNHEVSIGLQSVNGGMRPVGATNKPMGGESGTRVNYVVRLKWGNVPELALDTAASGTTAVKRLVPGANIADLVVSIKATPSDAPLVAGNFQDILIVKVGPSL